MVGAAECDSTKITDRQQMSKDKLAKPAQIWVYDFVATPADLPADSALAGKYAENNKPQTPEQIAKGRELGTLIETELVSQIRAMGMPAEHAVKETVPKINDIVLRGSIISFDEGDAKKRVGIGFGSGASELKVAIEGFQMTAQGLRKLGGGAGDAGGSKAPGAALGVVGTIATHNPLGLIISTGVKAHGEKTGSSKVEGRAKQTAKEIADILKQRFQEQGWVK
jgi:hypothetical protein